MYEAYYGLSANPFRLAPDPKFFFESACHKRGLSYLRYGLHQAQGFVVVTGVPGTGKSLLIQTLFSELAGRRMVIASLSNTNLCHVDILRAVANCFDIHYPEDNKAGLLGAIERFLIEQRRHGKHVLLIVDEAQNLPVASLEELRMLTNFQLGDQSLIQIMLLGQQQLQQILADPGMEQLSQRIIASCHLAPFGPNDMRSYIEHRLRCAGWRGRPSFSGEALKLIYHYSRGIPRLINTFCDRLMLAACLEEKDEIDLAHLNMVIEELKDEASGALRDFPPTAEDEAVELRPLPDGPFKAAAWPAAERNKAVTPAPALTDIEPPGDLTTQPDVDVEKEPVLESTVPQPEIEEVIVTPCYDIPEEETPTKKKGFWSFGGDQGEGPEISPSELLDEVKFKPKKGFSFKKSEPEPDIEANVESFPEPEAVDRVAEPVAPDYGDVESQKRSRWWIMPAAAAALVVVAMALFILWSEKTIEVVQKILPSAVEVSDNSPGALPEAAAPESLDKAEQERAEEERKVPASVVKPVPEMPQHKPDQSKLPMNSERQIQAINRPEPSVVDVPKLTRQPQAVEISEPPAFREVTHRANSESVASVDKNELLLPPAMSETDTGVKELPLPQEVILEIEAHELPDFMYSFAFAYENGDLDQFVSLFSNDASADGRKGINNIARDYREFFRATEMRSIDIKDVAWQPEGGKARGNGQFEVTVWRYGTMVPATIKGKIAIEVVKQQDERLYIKQLSLATDRQ